MKTLLASLTLLVAGCSSSFDGYEVTRAYEICAEHRGVDYLRTDSGVRCNDGTRWRVSGTKPEQIE